MWIVGLLGRRRGGILCLLISRGDVLGLGCGGRGMSLCDEVPARLGIGWRGACRVRGTGYKSIQQATSRSISIRARNESSQGPPRDEGDTRLYKAYTTYYPVSQWKFPLDLNFETLFLHCREGATSRPRSAESQGLGRALAAFRGRRRRTTLLGLGWGGLIFFDLINQCAALDHTTLSRFIPRQAARSRARGGEQP